MNASHSSSQAVNYFAKELSWLSFNERVLQESKDKSNPIIERMRFLGIYSNNMDEFFRVRVADVKRRILLNKIPVKINTVPNIILNFLQNDLILLKSIIYILIIHFLVLYLKFIKGLINV